MFSGAAFAAAPFAATGSNTFNSSVAESATGDDTRSAKAAFASTVLELVDATDVVSVVASVFSAAFVDAAQGTDSVSVAASTFGASVTESAEGSDNMLVAPSVFGATVLESADAVATVAAIASFVCLLSESADAADQILARLLWEIIDDSQSVSWGLVDDSQSTTWSNINDSAPTTWSTIPTINRD